MDSADEQARQAVARVAAQLREGRVRTEAIARWRPAGRILGILPRPERLRHAGEAWRLGVLLVTPGAELYALGTLVRSHRPERVGYAAESARERDALRHAAFEAGFPEGSTVHIEPTPVDLDAVASERTSRLLRTVGADRAGPLLRGPDGIRVRWAPQATAASARSLPEYLAEHADLLLHPRPGA